MINTRKREDHEIVLHVKQTKLTGENGSCGTSQWIIATVFMILVVATVTIVTLVMRSKTKEIVLPTAEIAPHVEKVHPAVTEKTTPVELPQLNEEYVCDGVRYRVENRHIPTCPHFKNGWSLFDLESNDLTFLGRYVGVFFTGPGILSFTDYSTTQEGLAEYLKSKNCSVSDAVKPIGKSDAVKPIVGGKSVLLFQDEKDAIKYLGRFKEEISRAEENDHQPITKEEHEDFFGTNGEWDNVTVKLWYVSEMTYDFAGVSEVVCNRWFKLEGADTANLDLKVNTPNGRSHRFSTDRVLKDLEYQDLHTEKAWWKFICNDEYCTLFTSVKGPCQQAADFNALI